MIKNCNGEYFIINNKNNSTYNSKLELYILKLEKERKEEKEKELLFKDY